MIVDGATVRDPSFETDLGGWEVLGPPEGTAPTSSDWVRSEAVIITWAATATEDTVLHGFGLEGVTTAEQRNEIMGRTLDYLVP